MEFLRICRMCDLPDPGALELRLPIDTRGLDVFLIRRHGQVYAYENHCPHTGAPLNWKPHHFLDAEGQRIICATHAALFRIADGACLSGPCAGQGLEPLPVEIRGSDVFVKSCRS